MSGISILSIVYWLSQSSKEEFFNNLPNSSSTQNAIYDGVMQGFLPMDKSSILDSLNAHWLTIWQNGSIIRILDKKIIDFKRPIMFELIGIDPDTTLPLTVYFTDSWTPRDKNAWTVTLENSINIVVKWNPDSVHSDETGAKIANEVVHYIAPKTITANEVEDLVKLKLSNVASFEYDQYTNNYWIDKGDPRILKKFKRYYDQFLSRSLCIQDINEGATMNEEIGYIVENILKNFAPETTYANDYIIEASVWLSLLHQLNPEIQKYKSEEDYIRYLNETYRNGKYKDRVEVSNIELVILKKDLLKIENKQ